MPGYTWLYLVMAGYAWFYLVIPGYGWLFMVIPGYTWLWMVVHGYFVVIPGYTWLWMVLHGYWWLCLVIPGYTWLWLVMLGYTWLYLVMDGYTWLYLVIPGYGLLYMVICGYAWLYLSPTLSPPLPSPPSSSLNRIISKCNGKPHAQFLYPLVDVSVHSLQNRGREGRGGNRRVICSNGNAENELVNIQRWSCDPKVATSEPKRRAGTAIALKKDISNRYPN